MSPDLRHLHLSISMATVRRYLAEDSMQFLDFFDALCRRYGKMLPAPLKLRSLVLGTVLFPRSVTTAFWLFNPEYLEEIHLDNELLHCPCVSSLTWSSTLAHTLSTAGYDENLLCFLVAILSPSICPRLRRLNASELRNEFWNALALSLGHGMPASPSNLLQRASQSELCPCSASASSRPTDN